MLLEMITARLNEINGQEVMPPKQLRALSLRQQEAVLSILPRPSITPVPLTSMRKSPRCVQVRLDSSNSPTKKSTSGSTQWVDPRPTTLLSITNCRLPLNLMK